MLSSRNDTLFREEVVEGGSEGFKSPPNLSPPVADRFSPPVGTVDPVLAVTLVVSGKLSFRPPPLPDKEERRGTSLLLVVEGDDVGSVGSLKLGLNPDSPAPPLPEEGGGLVAT